MCFDPVFTGPTLHKQNTAPQIFVYRGGDSAHPAKMHVH